MSNSTRCAACRSLRRRCPKDCVLAPYFPSNNPQRFAHVHKVFGASNITKMLKQLPENLRREAAECMCFEATSRVRDPVYGCAGIISQLQRQLLEVASEIVKTNGEIAFYHAQQHHQQEEDQKQEVAANVTEEEQEHGPYLWGRSNQDDPFDMDQQRQANSFQPSNYY